MRSVLSRTLASCQQQAEHGSLARQFSRAAGNVRQARRHATEPSHAHSAASSIPQTLEAEGLQAGGPHSPEDLGKPGVVAHGGVTDAGMCSVLSLTVLQVNQPSWLGAPRLAHPASLHRPPRDISSYPF